MLLLEIFTEYSLHKKEKSGRFPKNDVEYFFDWRIKYNRKFEMLQTKIPNRTISPSIFRMKSWFNSVVIEEKSRMTIQSYLSIIILQMTVIPTLVCKKSWVVTTLIICLLRVPLEMLKSGLIRFKDQCFQTFYRGDKQMHNLYLYQLEILAERQRQLPWRAVTSFQTWSQQQHLRHPHLLRHRLA